tara:strand:- start:521 stop:760 length:240 start_codon:yes stop_codon:yes gene_type:complete
MNKKDKETLKKHIVIKYAEELFDSIDFVDYTIYKLSSSKQDRMTLLDLESDRSITAEEYEDISSKVYDEFLDLSKDLLL